MAIVDVMRERLSDSFDLYHDLVAEVPEASLDLKLPGVPSNAVGDQLWCVVGARESFTRAVESGTWEGFSCSLTADETRARDTVLAGLSRSAEGVLAVIVELDSGDDARCRFVLRLLEHEAAHHGQLIRYLYGLRLPIPERWKAQYALD